MLRRLLVLVLLAVSGATWAQRVLTRPDFLALANGTHDYLFLNQIASLPDGGRLLAGHFQVWYEGKLFRDILRLRADGEPDTEWRVSADDNIDTAVVTPDGVVLVGTFTNVNGQAASRFARISLANATVFPFEPMPDVKSAWLGGYDAESGSVYFLAHMVDLNLDVRRIDVKSGRLDPGWLLRLPKPMSAYPSPFPPVIDGRGGLWITFVQTDCLGPCMTTKMARYSIAEPGRELIANIPSQWARYPRFAGEFVYVEQKRYRIADGTLDPAWTSFAYQAAGIDRGYLYAWIAKAGTPDKYNVLRRAPLSGNGTVDDWQLDAPDSQFISDPGGGILPLGAVNAPDAVVAFARYRPASAAPNPVAMIVNGESSDAPISVVEYYASVLKRYFITGRKAEQDALDALPTSFVRTGMRFNAKSSRYRDIPEQPVCRLYAAPDKGGSNSHFYGIGDDCPTLNKLPGLKYEGFDFSVIKATGAGCSADAPNIVTRLFNNKIATNEGNHRYVVSTVTKAKMLAQGWVDEGAVFCSVSVTDANLAN